MRNLEKDEIVMAERREMMLNTGFRIFAEKGIEAVPMQEIANACGLGIATVYRYFNTKLVFVIAIGAKKWNEFYAEVEDEYTRRGGSMMNAAEELDFYLGEYILLYREHSELLRFNQDFNGYVAHQKATAEQMREYRIAVDRYASKFHALYEKGKRDGSIRTDQTEQKMFTTTMHIMLAVAARYAQGLAYAGESETDLTEELMILKRMILSQYKA
ncbi:MAG: TetR/AcrR family transcriptional regulator [Clostridia bacterium]|nr:TetR/AcrR family transcriptional regulator [Clostridia bacterium]